MNRALQCLKQEVKGYALNVKCFEFDHIPRAPHRWCERHARTHNAGNWH